MTVSQVGRTTNSVTLNVSGITKGDRQTYIWIPNTISNTTSGWFTLQNAKNSGYISDFYVADYSTNNGDITVSVPYKYYSTLKNVGFRIKNGINIGTANETLYSSIDIYTILDFEYENSFPKYPGDDIDITVRDLQEINMFGRDIDMWFNDGYYSEYYKLNTVSTGDYIFAVYLWVPSRNILDAAINHPNLTGTYYNKVYNHLSNIVDNCVSGADFEAQFFNDIVYAIRNFNLSYTK